MTDNPELVEILTIALGSETFGIPASIVLEILDIGPITPVPNAPAFISSLINFRGRVAPLADLRLRCGIPVTEPTADNRIVVLEFDFEGEPTLSRDSGRQGLRGHPPRCRRHRSGAEVRHPLAPGIRSVHRAT